MENIISAKNIIKRYYNTKKIWIEVLKDISLEIPKEKITIVIGASGAGKSTLLHILGGLDKPDSGSVSINGKNITELRDKKLSKFRNKEVGFVFQFHHLLQEFSAVENIAIPLMIGGLSKKEAIKKSEYLLSLVGLDERKEHKPSELSGGEQQRVAVARALANDPPIIMADEPTGNLDSVNSEIINNLFVRLRDELKKTCLIVTHNSELMKLGDYLIELKDGKIK